MTIATGSRANDVSIYDTVYVLLHGFFFMEFLPSQQPNKLAVTAPEVRNHTFKCGQKGLLTDLPPSVDWVTAQKPLKQGSITSFDDPSLRPIARLPKMMVGAISGAYHARITLPLPKQIIPLRLGQLSDFHTDITSRTGAAIQTLCGTGGNTQLSIITCLVYDRDAPATGNSFVYNFYVEDLKGDFKSENDAFFDASQVFDNPSGFDLLLTADSPCIPPTNEAGVAAEDEYSLAEIAAKTPCISTRGTSLANCVPMGLV